MMTKRHYQQFADMLNLLVVECAGLHVSQHVLVKHIAIELADICQRDNPRFNRERFMAACGF